MLINDAYKNLTEEAKSLAIRACVSLAEADGLRVSPAYMRQIMLGKRAKGCSAELARVISAHFRGYIGIDVSPDEVIIRAEEEKNGRGRTSS